MPDPESIIPMTRWFGDGRLFLPAILACGVLSGHEVAPAPALDTSIEDFQEVDPYTGGKREALDRLGYVSLGPFMWADGHSSADLADTLGGVSVIFIETEHFRIASSLRAYERGADSAEKKLLKAEVARLGKRLGKLRPSKELDPWLRAHLYAQRLEELYADFLDRFGFEDGDFGDQKSQARNAVEMGSGPYLGQEQKFTVLLCEQSSGLGRYTARYMNSKSDVYFRWRFEDSIFFGAAFEALRDVERRLDLNMFLALTGGVVMNLVEGFRQSGHDAPMWFKYGLAHYYSNRLDPRWPNWGAGGSTNPEVDKLWEWEPRVRGLVTNKGAASWQTMMGWRTAEDVKPRDHMLAWSRVRWLIEEKPEGLRELLLGLTEPVSGSTPEELAESGMQQQELAFVKAYGATPEELEGEWTRHVRRRYSR